MGVKKSEKNTIGKGKPGPGRPKGTPNRTTALLKDAILTAAQEAGGGGDDGMANYLAVQAKKNPGPFLTLLGKVLPMQAPIDQDGETVTGYILVPLTADD